MRPRFLCKKSLKIYDEIINCISFIQCIFFGLFARGNLIDLNLISIFETLRKISCGLCSIKAVNYSNEKLYDV